MGINNMNSEKVSNASAPTYEEAVGSQPLVNQAAQLETQPMVVHQHHVYVVQQPGGQPVYAGQAQPGQFPAYPPVPGQQYPTQQPNFMQQQQAISHQPQPYQQQERRGRGNTRILVISAVKTVVDA